MDPQDLFEQLARGQFHEGGLKCARIGIVADDVLLELIEEAQEVVAKHRPSVVSKGGHVTNWTKPWGKVLQWSLLNTTGQTHDTTTDHNNTRANKRFHLMGLPALKAWTQSAWPEATNMRLNLVGPNSGLGAHEEDICFKDGDGRCTYKVRLHLPLVTTGEAAVMLDWELFHFGVGQVCYFNTAASTPLATTGRLTASTWSGTLGSRSGSTTRRSERCRCRPASAAPRIN